MSIWHLLSAALAAQSAPTAEQPAPNAPQAVIVRPFSPNERRESMRLEALGKKWAEGVRQRHKLLKARCWIAWARSDRTSCFFELDGITVYFSKAGRHVQAPKADRVSIRTEVEWVSGVRRVTSGAWIKEGDLIEIEATGNVYTDWCRALDSLEVECLPFGKLDGVEGRLSYPRARYTTVGFPEAAGKAFVDGSVRMLRNGKPVSLQPLIAAAREFARQDFEAVARLGS